MAETEPLTRTRLSGVSKRHRGFLKVSIDEIIVGTAGPSVVVVVVVVVVVLDDADVVVIGGGGESLVVDLVVTGGGATEVVVLEAVVTGGGAIEVVVFEVVVVVVVEQLPLSPHLAPGLQAPHNSPTLHTVPGLSQQTAFPA